MEDYKKKYEEVLKRAKQLLKTSVAFDRFTIENIFPELKESKDEQIRKVLVEWFKRYKERDTCGSEMFNGIPTDNILAWLEKQDKQKETLCEKCKKAQPSHSCQDITALGRCAVEHEQKTADDVEPKFHKGDWITNGDYTWKIVKVKPLDYILQSQDGNIVDDTISHVDEHFHSFTIEDAKDGDVLCCENGWTCIFKTLINDENFSSYCFMDRTKSFFETGSECHTLNKEFMKAYNGEIKPATKEQRDALERAITNAGYRWDKEKLKLEKI